MLILQEKIGFVSPIYWSIQDQPSKQRRMALFRETTGPRAGVCRRATSAQCSFFALARLAAISRSVATPVRETTHEP